MLSAQSWGNWRAYLLCTQVVISTTIQRVSPPAAICRSLPRILAPTRCGVCGHMFGNDRRVLRGGGGGPKFGRADNLQPPSDICGLF